jgi:hypothetical protein
MTYSRAVITPAPGRDPVEFDHHKGLTLKEWQGYAPLLHGWQATVEVIETGVSGAFEADPLPAYHSQADRGRSGPVGGLSGQETHNESTPWTPWWTAELEAIYGWRGKPKRRRARDARKAVAATATGSEVVRE